MVEAAGGASAEHGGAGLVHALVELRGADVALLVVIVRGARHDFGVRRVYGAAGLASVRLDRDGAAGRFRARGELALRRGLVGASRWESAGVVVMVMEGLSVSAMSLLQCLVRARAERSGSHWEQIAFGSCVESLLLHRLDYHVIGRWVDGRLAIATVLAAIAVQAQALTASDWGLVEARRRWRER